MSVIVLDRVTTGYSHGRKTTPISRDLSVTLSPGTFTVLLGPNGAGKSTLLRTVAGLQPPLAGTVQLDGDNITALEPRERARRLGVVLTDTVRPWGLTTHAMVALGRQPHTGWSGTLSEADHAAINTAIDAAGAADLLGRQVAELSDGERQRVMVARALAQEPRALILDEVTAFLDLPRRVDTMLMLRRLTRESGRALLLSTHDLDLALRTADRIWLMGRGGAFHVGTPEELVLTGALYDVFRHEGVDFDAALGAFRLHASTSGTIGLHGEGLPEVWTRRALERIGLAVVADAADHILIDAGPVWHLHRGGVTQRFDTLGALTDALR
jgi:iron complex transport system ATP-binding protein